MVGDGRGRGGTGVLGGGVRLLIEASVQIEEVERIAGGDLALEELRLVVLGALLCIV